MSVNAVRIDEPRDDQPFIELAVVGYRNEGEPLSMTFISGGKEYRFKLKPHVAASMIAALAKGLVSGQ
jgi:hypothetical protein